MIDPKDHKQPAFDDALPEGLVGIVADEGEKKPKLHIGAHTQVSPFIVRLSRGLPQVRSNEQIQDELQLLAESLIFDEDEAPRDEEAPLVSLQENGDLSLATDDMLGQLREHDVALKPMRPLHRLVSDVPVDDILPAAYTTAVPVPLDIVEEFAVEPSVFTQIAPAARPVVDDIYTVEMEIDEPMSLEAAVDDEPMLVVAEPERLVVYRPTLHRKFVTFVGLALALVLPLHAFQVLAGMSAEGDVAKGESEAALNAFLRGATSAQEEDFATAGDDFAAAADRFKEAQASLDDLNSTVVAVVNVIPSTDRTVDSVKALVTAGRELSETAAIMSSAAEDLSSRQSGDITTKLELLGAYIENAIPHAQAAADAVQDIDMAVVPVEYAEAVNDVKLRAPQLASSMHEFLTFLDALVTVLGGDQKMRYLAAFQNNTELRPTGGFVGSFAEMDVEKGEITRLSVPGGGSYAAQGQLTEYVAAPGPLQLLKARWEFQDANWFPDFPTSAQKMTWFYSASGGPSTDGVVAVNATFVADLLAVLGPVEMPQYGRTFDAENFIFETQKIVELEYDKEENAPKAIIGEMAPILLDRVKDADFATLVAVMDLVAKGLQEKDIQIYFNDNELESMVERLGWAGDMKQTSGDYLMAVSTNLGGGKTDGVIDQNINLDVRIAEDGTVENTVTITKTHRGMRTELFAGVNNVDYLRLYVPQGSTLLSAEGFEIPPEELFETSDVPLAVDDDLALHMQAVRKDEATGTDIWNEGGKTVFGNFMQTAPGETQEIRFTYRLPWKVTPEDSRGLLAFAKEKLGVPETVPYSLFVQKQSGVENRETTVHLDVPADLTAVWSSAPTIQTTVTVPNTQDAFVGWLFERK